MKRIMMTMAVAAMGMTAMMAQSHEVTTTDKNGNKVVYEISDAAATKGLQHSTRRAWQRAIVSTMRMLTIRIM